MAYIYIYTHTERERERDVDRGRLLTFDSELLVSINSEPLPIVWDTTGVFISHGRLSYFLPKAPN